MSNANFQHFQYKLHTKCQQKTWMDEEIILKWAEEVLEPYVADPPEDTLPMLILDNCRRHMMILVCELF